MLRSSHRTLGMKASLKIILLLTLAPLLMSANSQASDSIRFFGQCRFYQELAGEMGCHRDNYLITFGAYYCQKFQSAAALFSPEGRIFLENMRLCLQAELEKVEGLNCQNVRRIGLGSHAVCFNRHRFCRLPAFDKVLLFSKVIPSLFDEKAKVDASEFEISCR